MVFLQYPVVCDPDNANRVVVNQDAADTLNNALVKDLPVQLTGTTGRAAETAPTPTLTRRPPTRNAETAPTAPTAPTSPATPAPTVAPTPGQTSVPLPSDITGQTAAQQTCTKGNN